MSKDELPREVAEFPGEGWPLVFDPELRNPRPVQVGRLWLPETFHTTLWSGPHDSPDWVVTMMYAVVEGEVSLLMVLTDGEDVPIALDKVRRHRSLDWWKRRAVRAAASELAEHAAEMMFSDGEFPLDPDDSQVAALEVIGRQRAQWVQSQMSAAASTTTTRRRDRITSEHLEQVARVYREAKVKPTQAVADYFDRPHSTAADWVGRARKAGFLGPSVGTKGGERA